MLARGSKREGYDCEEEYVLGAGLEVAVPLEGFGLATSVAFPATVPFPAAPPSAPASAAAPTPSKFSWPREFWVYLELNLTTALISL